MLFARLRRILSAPTAPAPRSDRDLLARTEEFNRNAEAYWRDVRGDPTGRRHVLNKPFGAPSETPSAVYRLGLVLAELRLGPGHRVLDFGAGSCWLASCLNRMGCRTIAVDVSPSALDLGRELFALDPRHRRELDPRFLPFDGHHLPLEDASVDRVACFDAFHHVPNQDEVLAELFRVLAPGGRLVMAEPGEGHSHAEHSVFDAEQHDVLENELDVLDLDRRARAAGFTSVTLKPYPDPGLLRLEAAEYVRLMDGDATPFPMAELQRNLRLFFLVTMTKGPERHDSRCPSLLRAAIERRDDGALSGRGGATVALPLRIVNAGDTTWRSEPDPAGGWVLVAGHLADGAGRTISRAIVRTPLPRDVPPGDAIEVELPVPLPQERGAYRLVVDLLVEHVTFFSQLGSPTLDVPLVVEGLADGVDPDAWRAEIATSALAGRVAPGARLVVPVTIVNRGRAAWPRAAIVGPGTIRLGVQLLREDGSALDRDHARIDVPSDVGPGASFTTTLVLPAPETPGAYALGLDMVAEHVCWFAQRGSSPSRVPFVVDPAVVPDSAAPRRLAAELHASASTAGPGAPARVTVTARNVGDTRWRAAPGENGGHVRLGGRWVRGGDAGADATRIGLPDDVPPGGTVTLSFDVELPPGAGPHVLELDMVDEGIVWFAAEGSAPVHVELTAAG